MAGVAVPGDPNAAGPVTETFAAPDDYGDLRASELHSSLGEQLGAEAGEAFGGGMRSLWRAAGYFAAEHGWQPPLSENDARLREPWGPDEPVPSVPDVSMADARARVKQEGLEHQITLPNQPSIHPGVLEMMIRDGHDRTQYNAAVARGPQGFWPSALGAVTQIGAGMIDPVNAAAFSIPLMGEARYGKILATAGENIFARAAIKTGVGAAQGAVGGAALEPLDWWLHTQDGSDYTYADALKSVVLSAGMGGAFHGGFGLAGDVSARLRGLPLEGAHGVAGTHLPEAALGEGVNVNEVPGVAPQAGAPLGENLRERLGLTHPAEMLADLPPEAQEDVLKASIANLTSGRLNNAAEMLQEAAKADPRIAESFDAYHGSPHDFDQFDINKIGTGEGAQSYGHGLYFAENEKVARGYQRTTSDKAFIDKVRDLYDEGFGPGEAWDEIKDNWGKFSPGEQRLMTALQKDDWLGFDYPHQAVSAALRDIKNFDVSPETADAARAMGNMYRVKVNANPEHFLDWDKPLSEQSPRVQQAVQGLFPDRDPNILGQTLGKYLEGFAGKTPEDAAIALRQAGITGIKYLDQGSRQPQTLFNGQPIPHDNVAAQLAAEKLDLHGSPDKAISSLQRDAQGGHPYIRDASTQAAELLKSGQVARHQPSGTSNYVVFDDKLIRITHKNGKEVGLDEAKLAAKAGQHGKLEGGELDKVVSDATARAAERPIVETPMPSGANSSRDPNGPVYVDPRVPEPLRRPVAVHETVEEALMARGYPYAEAHKIATQAEKQAVEAAGMDWGRYTHEWDGLLDTIEREKVPKAELPSDLHVDPEAAIGHHRAASKGADAATEPAKKLLPGGSTLSRNASWVIRDKATKEPIMETFDQRKVEALNADKYEAVPILQYLGEHNQLVRDHGTADWSKLANGRNPDDAELASTSREADKAPDPPDTPEKAVTQAEQAAADAENGLKEMLAALPEDERKPIEDALAAVTKDKASHEQMIRETMACLMSAAGAA